MVINTGLLFFTCSFEINMGLLRTLAFMVLAYFVWRFLDNFFSGNGGDKRSRPKKKDDVKFRQKPRDKGHIPDDEGDYIDFEESK